jgi:hypothetical protein
MQLNDPAPQFRIGAGNRRSVETGVSSPSAFASLASQLTDETRMKDREQPALQIGILGPLILIGEGANDTG